MTGADRLLRTLADGSVDICFANPGTSEMHLLAALDREPRIRPVLCLFEGVASGAADGYARIAGKPAMTLLHLGPGYANAAANIHNARRASSPMINLVGDHATGHQALDAPLASDIAGLAAASSIAVLTSGKDGSLEEVASAALTACRSGSGGPVALIVPADHAWSEEETSQVSHPADISAIPEARLPPGVVEQIREARAPALLLGGAACACLQSLSIAARLQAAGIELLCDTFIARQCRSHDIVEPRRLPYFAEEAVGFLERHDLLLLCGTQAPVSFFAYPGRPGSLVPHGTQVLRLAPRGVEPAPILAALAKALGCNGEAKVPQPRPLPDMPTGPCTPASVGESLARHLPENAIISDDGVTSSGPVFAAMTGRQRHDWLSLTGGAIGQGLPVAIGAAIAAPGRRVVALSGDGAAMYTPQALWTMAREGLDILVVVFVNEAYRILDIEFVRTDAGDVPGQASRDLLDLARPSIDWTALGGSMGVRSETCRDAESFDEAVAAAVNRRGPSLVAAVIA